MQQGFWSSATVVVFFIFISINHFIPTVCGDCAGGADEVCLATRHGERYRDASLKLIERQSIERENKRREVHNQRRNERYNIESSLNNDRLNRAIRQRENLQKTIERRNVEHYDHERRSMHRTNKPDRRSITNLNAREENVAERKQPEKSHIIRQERNVNNHEIRSDRRIGQLKSTNRNGFISEQRLEDQSPHREERLYRTDRQFRQNENSRNPESDQFQRRNLQSRTRAKTIEVKRERVEDIRLDPTNRREIRKMVDNRRIQNRVQRSGERENRREIINDFREQRREINRHRIDKKDFNQNQRLARTDRQYERMDRLERKYEIRSGENDRWSERTERSAQLKRIEQNMRRNVRFERFNHKNENVRVRSQESDRRNVRLNRSVRVNRNEENRLMRIDQNERMIKSNRFDKTDQPRISHRLEQQPLKQVANRMHRTNSRREDRTNRFTHERLNRREQHHTIANQRKENGEMIVRQQNSENDQRRSIGHDLNGNEKQRQYRSIDHRESHTEKNRQIMPSDKLIMPSTYDTQDDWINMIFWKILQASLFGAIVLQIVRRKFNDGHIKCNKNIFLQLKQLTLPKSLKVL